MVNHDRESEEDQEVGHDHVRTKVGVLPHIKTLYET